MIVPYKIHTQVLSTPIYSNCSYTICEWWVCQLMRIVHLWRGQNGWQYLYQIRLQLGGGCYKTWCTNNYIFTLDKVSYECSKDALEIWGPNIEGKCLWWTKSSILKSGHKIGVQADCRTRTVGCMLCRVGLVGHSIFCSNQGLDSRVNTSNQLDVNGQCSCRQASLNWASC